MLAKKYRLPIQSVFKKSGRSIKGRYFLLKVFSNDLAFNRFGVIISRKVAKKATARNKLKRLMFDALKDFLHVADTGSDFLIIVSPRILELKVDEIKKELQKLIPRPTFYENND